MKGKIMAWTERLSEYSYTPYDVTLERRMVTDQAQPQQATSAAKSNSRKVRNGQRNQNTQIRELASTSIGNSKAITLNSQSIINLADVLGGRR